MTSAALRALVVAAVLSCGACMTTPAPSAPTPAAAPAPTGPSPRPECAPAHVTIYFSDEVQSAQPVAMPLLNDLMNLVHTCETAGGALRGITIDAAADPGQTASDGAAQVRRRQDRIRTALIGLGAPADKIHNGHVQQTGPETVMGRRAEVAAELY
jgi:hypothetical protein